MRRTPKQGVRIDLLYFYGTGTRCEIHPAKITHKAHKTVMMIMKSCVAVSFALCALSAPRASAFYTSGGLPRGSRGVLTRGGEKTVMSAMSGFDIGEWLRQAFSPPKSTATKKGRWGDGGMCSPWAWARCAASDVCWRGAWGAGARMQ